MDLRKLTDHVVSGDSANHQLELLVIDGPGAGGACHHYQINGFDAFDNPSNVKGDNQTGGPGRCTVLFQNGPIKEFGVNGVTQEVLLAIVIDRLRSFQAGPYSCRENAIALTHCEDALMWLQRRTSERIKRGVEGTHQK